MSETDNLDQGGMDLEKLLEEKERLEGIIRDKFTRVVTVMFTDLTGSTSIAEQQGDLSTRSLIKDHNNIVFPLIKDNGGVLVKSMGDGTLSYFPDPLGALRAAVGIQRDFAAYNDRKKHKNPVRIRVGMHTGNVIIEEDDIFGDVVNTASRFESSADPGDIQLSEETFNALADKEEIPCRYVRDAVLKGKKEPFRIYKAYWNPDDIEKDLKSESAEPSFDIDEETIMVSKSAPSPDIPRPAAVRDADETFISSDDPSLADESAVMHQAEVYERDREFVRLFLHLNKFAHINTAGSLLADMNSSLSSEGPHDTNFLGEEALWFFKDAITTGRLKDADLPLTNKAISRIPVTVGISGGNSFLRIQAEATDSISQIEIESGNSRQEVSPNTDYMLGDSGRIIISSCFPVEFKTYKDRLLVLRFTAVEDCVRAVMNLSLKDVWGNFEKESARLIIIGN